jgi:hypothetical protein
MIANYTVTTNITEIIDLDNYTSSNPNFINAIGIQPKIENYSYINISIPGTTGDVP